MRKVFADALRKQLGPFFEARFPDFLPYKPKPVGEEKSRPLPLTTDYFRRVHGKLWEIIAVRRLSRDARDLDILWSFHDRFPYSRLSLDYVGDIARVRLQDEAHTGINQFVQNRAPSVWSVWECSLPYNHPNFQAQCIIEYLQPVEVGVAERAVAEQLESTAAVIEKFVLPLFAELERRADMPGSRG